MIYLMEDGARSHTSENNQILYIQHHIIRLPWAPNSPDLNPIEHAWRWMKQYIGRLNPRPTTISDCKIALVDAWEKLPIELINKWVNNQSRRVHQVIEHRGNNTFHG